MIDSAIVALHPIVCLAVLAYWLVHRRDFRGLADADGPPPSR